MPNLQDLTQTYRNYFKEWRTNLDPEWVAELDKQFDTFLGKEIRRSLGLIGWVKWKANGELPMSFKDFYAQLLSLLETNEYSRKPSKVKFLHSEIKDKPPFLLGRVEERGLDWPSLEKVDNLGTLREELIQEWLRRMVSARMKNIFALESVIPVDKILKAGPSLNDHYRSIRTNNTWQNEVYVWPIIEPKPSSTFSVSPDEIRKQLTHQSKYKSTFENASDRFILNLGEQLHAYFNQAEISEVFKEVSLSELRNLDLKTEESLVQNLLSGKSELRIGLNKSATTFQVTGADPCNLAQDNAAQLLGILTIYAASEDKSTIPHKLIKQIAKFGAIPLKIFDRARWQLESSPIFRADDIDTTEQIPLQEETAHMCNLIWFTQRHRILRGISQDFLNPQNLQNGINSSLDI